PLGRAPRHAPAAGAEARSLLRRLWRRGIEREKELKTMPVTVKIPAPLRPLIANQGEVAVENATTVQAALEQLSRKYPGIKEKLLDDKGALRRYVNLFRNDEDVRHAQGLSTALKEGDRLTIVPAIAGGC